MASPDLSGLDSTTFAENTVNAAPQLLDAAVVFTDADNDFNGGKLIVSGLLAEDRITLVGDGSLWVSGGYLHYDSNGAMPGGMFSIGTVTGGAGGTFTIDFNLPASGVVTASIVDMIVQRLAYQNVSDTPTATRDLTINIVDAAGNDLVGAPSYTQQTGPASPVDGLTANFWTRPAFADLDNDGDIDMVVTDFMGDAQYFENTGTATAPVLTLATSPITIPAGVYFGTIALGDMDGDGDLDAIVGDGTSGTILYFRNTGSAGTPVFEQQTGGDNPFGAVSLGSTSYASPALGDVDGDGDLDLVVGHKDGTLAFYRNTGTAALPTYEQQAGGANPFNSYSRGLDEYASPSLADIDGDGDLDLVLGTSFGSFKWMENTGAATAPNYVNRGAGTEPFPLTVDGGRYTSPAFVDLDGDGDLDLVSGSEDSGLSYFQNTSAVAPRITVTVTAEAEPVGPTAGDDTVAGTTGDDDIAGLAGADDIDGGGGDDFLDGGEGDDTLVGGSGADYLRGGTGADAMSGGTGDDFYVIDDAGDTTDETGGDGVDLVHSRITWTLAADLENLTLAAPGRDIDGTGNGLANIITGNDFANTLTGLAGDDTLIGAGRNDVLYGGAGADILDGGLHEDQLFGGADADDLIGGGGHDRLDGGTGGDDMVGGIGNDVYVVDDLGDTVTELASGGTDTVESSVSWTLAANVENLTLTGGAWVNGFGNDGRNVMIGNDTVNVMVGGGEVDTISGMGGGDHMFGGLGNDIINGGDGIDVLSGAEGSDKLTGGADADWFLFTGEDLAAVAVERDEILDLSFAAGDVISLVSIDANTTLFDDQNFTWAVGNKFSKHAGELTLKYVASTNITTLEMDVDGDGKADFRIAITGDVSGTTGNLSTGAGDTDGGWLL